MLIKFIALYLATFIALLENICHRLQSKHALIVYVQGVVGEVILLKWLKDFSKLRGSNPGSYAQ